MMSDLTKWDNEAISFDAYLAMKKRLKEMEREILASRLCTSTFIELVGWKGEFEWAKDYNALRDCARALLIRLDTRKE